MLVRERTFYWCVHRGWGTCHPRLVLMACLQQGSQRPAPPPILSLQESSAAPRLGFWASLPRQCLVPGDQVPSPELWFISLIKHALMRVQKVPPQELKSATFHLGGGCPGSGGLLHVLSGVTWAWEAGLHLMLRCVPFTSALPAPSPAHPSAPSQGLHGTPAQGLARPLLAPSTSTHGSSLWGLPQLRPLPHSHLP